MAQTAPNGIRPATILALLLGLGNAVFGLWRVSQNGHVGIIGIVWGGIGLTATVAVPLVLLTRYSLLTPMLTVAVFVNGFYLADPGPTAGEPFVGYVLLWPVLVGTGLLLGGIEYFLRARYGLAPPRPLTV